MTTPDSTTPTKRCSKCGKELPATTEYFYRKGGGKLRPDCKACFAGPRKAWCAANSVSEAARKKAWLAAHKDTATETHRAWYAANRERAVEASKAWYQANKTYRAEYRKAWYEANQERSAESRKAWAAANPDKVKASRHLRRARKANVTGAHTAADIRAQLKRQKGRCYWCGEKVTDYHIDHVIPLSRGGSNGPDNLVIACPSCNLRKGSKLPHEWNGNGGRLL